MAIFVVQVRYLSLLAQPSASVFGRSAILVLSRFTPVEQEYSSCKFLATEFRIKFAGCIPRIRWGPVVSDQVHHVEQRLYMSEQTDGSAPNTLVVATASVCSCCRQLAATHLDLKTDKLDEQDVQSLQKATCVI